MIHYIKQPILFLFSSIKNMTQPTTPTSALATLAASSMADIANMPATQLYRLPTNTLPIVARKLCESLVGRSFAQLQLLAHRLGVAIITPEGNPLNKAQLCESIREALAQQQFAFQFEGEGIRGQSLQHYENLLAGETREELDEFLRAHPEFVDITSLDLMIAPILVSSGFSYDYHWLIQWTTNQYNQRGHIQDVQSRARLLRYGFPNKNLRNAIRTALLEQLGIADMPNPHPELWADNVAVDLHTGEVVSIADGQVQQAIAQIAAIAVPSAPAFAPAPISAAARQVPAVVPDQQQQQSLITATSLRQMRQSIVDDYESRLDMERQYTAIQRQRANELQNQVYQLERHIRTLEQQRDVMQRESETRLRQQAPVERAAGSRETIACISNNIIPMGGELFDLPITRGSRNLWQLRMMCHDFLVALSLFLCARDVADFELRALHSVANELINFDTRYLLGIRERDRYIELIFNLHWRISRGPFLSNAQYNEENSVVQKWFTSSNLMQHPLNRSAAARVRRYRLEYLKTQEQLQNSRADVQHIQQLEQQIQAQQDIENAAINEFMNIRNNAESGGVLSWVPFL